MFASTFFNSIQNLIEYFVLGATSKLGQLCEKYTGCDSTTSIMEMPMMTTYWLLLTHKHIYVAFFGSIGAEQIPLSTMKGGFKRNLLPQAQAKAESKRGPPPTSSKLAKRLLEQWCWGRMSLPTLQQMAMAAVEDGLEDVVLRLLGVGNINTIWPKNKNRVCVWGVFSLWVCGLEPQGGCGVERLNLGTWGSKFVAELLLSLCRRLASMGSSGAYANHMHRDLLRIWGVTWGGVLGQTSRVVWK